MCLFFEIAMIKYLGYIINATNTYPTNYISIVNIGIEAHIYNFFNYHSTQIIIYKTTICKIN